MLVQVGLSQAVVDKLLSAEAFATLDLQGQGVVEKQMLLDSLHTFGGDKTWSPRCLHEDAASPAAMSPEQQHAPPKRVTRSAMHALHLMYNSGAIPESMIHKPMNEMKAAFEQLDTDRSGYLDYEELQAGLQRLGAGLSEAELQQLWRLMAVGGNGPRRLAKGINYAAFSRALSQYKTFEMAVKMITDALRPPLLAPAFLCSCGPNALPRMADRGNGSCSDTNYVI